MKNWIGIVLLMIVVITLLSIVIIQQQKLNSSENIKTMCIDAFVECSITTVELNNTLQEANKLLDKSLIVVELCRLDYFCGEENKVFG